MRIEAIVHGGSCAKPANGGGNGTEGKARAGLDAEGAGCSHDTPPGDDLEAGRRQGCPIEQAFELALSVRCN